MKKHYKPKTKNVTKLKSYLDKKIKTNDRSKTKGLYSNQLKC